MPFREWKKEILKVNPCLIKTIFRVTALRMFFLTLVTILKVQNILVNFYHKIFKIYSQEVILVAQPLLIRNLIRYFNDQIDFNWAFLYGSIFCLNAILNNLIHHPYFFNLQRQGMRIRLAITGIIFKKVKFKEFMDWDRKLIIKF